MKIQLQAKSSGLDSSQVQEIETPCKISLEIGTRLIKFEVDAKEGVRIVGDTGSPEDNTV